MRWAGAMKPSVLTVMTAAVLWAAVVVSASAETGKKPKITEEITYYDVSALTSDGLRREMRRKGPRGYWAYAQWWVSWTDMCDITVTQTIEMPRHTRLDDLPPELRVRWDSMVRALLRHERLHTRHGELAAGEIAMAKCQGAYQIIDRWANQDKVLDRRTDHGRKEGVTLP